MKTISSSIILASAIILSALFSVEGAENQNLATTNPNVMISVLPVEISRAGCGCKNVLVQNGQVESPGVCYDPQANQTCSTVGCSVTYRLIDAQTGVTRDFAVTTTTPCNTTSCAVNATAPLPRPPPLSCTVSVLDLTLNQALPVNGQCLNQQGRNNVLVCGCTANIRMYTSLAIVNGAIVQVNPIDAIVFFTPCDSV